MRILLAPVVLTQISGVFAQTQCNNDAIEYSALDLPDDPAVDPWIDVKWHTDDQGCFNPQIDQQTVPRLYYDSATEADWNANHRAVVVHNADGDKVGCGVINYDVWNIVTYESDADGNAGTGSVASSPVYGFETSSVASEKYVNAYGRAVVVHASDGTRVGCGCCVGDADSISMNPYPDYGGNISVSGTVNVTGLDGGYVSIEPSLSGLEAGATGGIHIHTGTSCTASGNVGGHLYRNDGAQIGVYPGYTGDEVVVGFADVASLTDSSISFSTSLVNENGIGVNSTGGIHIHEGTTCSDAGAVGGHYWDTSTTTGAPTTTSKNAYSAASAGQPALVIVGGALAAFLLDNYGA